MFVPAGHLMLVLEHGERVVEEAPEAGHVELKALAIRGGEALAEGFVEHAHDGR